MMRGRTATAVEQAEMDSLSKRTGKFPRRQGKGTSVTQTKPQEAAPGIRADAGRGEGVQSRAALVEEGRHRGTAPAVFYVEPANEGEAC
ncbi:hypothetical protein LJK88_49960 [Paenibacillus sp. P26]|nr:hypothetical protein LJK88_49960 [Paenibacillus sp. P26]UUZ91445.1 hypothetical protein LJK87_38365 [Paenibacillus sp. P25]